MTRLKLSVSLQYYASKEDIQPNKLRFNRSFINISEFEEYIKKGFCFCHWFDTKADEFSSSEKNSKNFERANVIFVDVDDNDMEMKQFVSGLSMKPTVYYTTPNNLNPSKGNKYRFRLCYVFCEDMRTCEMFTSTYKAIINSIRKDFPLYPDKDKCGGTAAQYFNGNGTCNCEVYTTKNVYRLADFGVSFVVEPQHKNIVVATDKDSKRTTKDDKRITAFPITDKDFINDLNTFVPSELLDKYKGKYGYFDHSELSFNDGYALIPKDYHEIYRCWYLETETNKNGNTRKVSVVKRIRDGDGRRKCLYIGALIRRMIRPYISFEHLLYNLVAERQWYYDNSDKVLTNDVLMQIANNALNIPIEKINIKTKRKPSKFKVDKSYCLQNGIKPKAMVGIVRRKLKDEEIGELYDCNLSVKQNLDLLKANGMKIGLSRLYEFCDRNNIPRRCYRKKVE